VHSAELDRWHMARALALAARGQGAVEPNPMVGALVCHGAETVGEGWHRAFGGPHAESWALEMAGSRARGATLYVTLEPCCHHGKTPPCTGAIMAAGIRRVVAAMEDVFPLVAGRGIAELRAAGLEVECGVLETDARRLNAPYLKLNLRSRPWVHAKWAMTLDGKIATRGGESQWISNEASRRIVHELRGRVDAVIVGRGTAHDDDPLLTARPPGPRTAVRIVLDSRASLSPESRLARTARDIPVLIAACPAASVEAKERLIACGCEVIDLPGATPTVRLEQLIDELGRRRMTNVLIEGGSGVLGAAFDARLIDEIHAFVSPRLAGGRQALSPVGGQGIELMSGVIPLDDQEWRVLDGDFYVRGRVRWP
jgi:diaminohydroxyphosphoribosylaminopyrimidine deaminase/5-amino-6-(5-phosphoribosylamino)uracil reductase